jgi:hypothetical protein
MINKEEAMLINKVEEQPQTTKVEDRGKSFNLEERRPERERSNLLSEQVRTTKYKKSIYNG